MPVYTNPSRKRGKVRPLSQTGLIRQPMNPRQRQFGEGGTKQQGAVLEAFNERQEHSQIHPTKGWRGLSVKRARAQMLMAEMRNGQGRHLRLQARFLTEGY